MSGTGPPPKPTALKLLQGNPGRRPINDKEPMPDTATPDEEPPIPLGDEARQIWRAMVPMMTKIGLLTVCDTRLLARYCDLFVRWIKARDFIDQKGETYIKYEYYNDPVLDKEGKQTGSWVRKQRPKAVVAYPQVATYLQSGRELVRLEGELGLTPAARSRIKIEVFGGKSSSDDNFLTYLSGNTRKPLVG